MIDERRLSIAIPTYQRVELLFESFEQVHDDERVSEVIIVDDASDDLIWGQIEQLAAFFPKVKLFRNNTNIDCYKNKKLSASYCNSEFTIVLDSDNKIDKDYLDRIFECEWREDTILTPSFAAPTFDFRAYEGLTITKENVAHYIDRPLFETMLNAFNFFINKNEYAKIFDDSIDPVTSDSIFFCMKWLEAGNKIFVVPGLHYFHRIHSNGHYNGNVHRTPAGFHQSILDTLKSMS